MRFLVGFVLVCFVTAALMATTFFYRTLTTPPITPFPTPTTVIVSQPTSVMITVQPTTTPPTIPPTIQPTTKPTIQPMATNQVGFVINEESIPFETRWEPSELFELDTTGVITEGKLGVLQRKYRTVSVDGVELERELLHELIVQKPVDQVNGYGTRIVVRTLETPDGELRYWRKVEMRVTSYTAATSGKVRSDPWYGVTASGWMAGYGVVAVDPAVVPWLTYVYVPGYGRGFVGDTGGGIIGRWIDLGYDEDAFEWWSGTTDVYHLTPVPEPERINYLLPQELP